MSLLYKLKTYADIDLDRQIEDLCYSLNNLQIIGSSDSPPTAAEIYRGRVWLVLGASGAADSLQICLKSAADTYSWKVITSG